MRIALVVMLLVVMGPVTVAAPSYPKLAAYWTSPLMTLEQARELSKFHLVIADMENLVNNRDSLAMLKKLNPKVKLLAYSNPMEFFEPMVSGRPLQKNLLEEVQQSYSAWFLKQPDGRPVKFYQGMRMMNLSSLCPVVDDLRWNEYLTKFLLDKVLSDPIWDGYFMDNSGGNISWVNGGNIDADADGVKDEPERLDKSWWSGIREFLSIIHQTMGKEFILVGNKGSLEFLELFDGKMFEEFPNSYLGSKEAGGWHQSLANAIIADGPYTIIQAKANGEDSWRMFVLASALLTEAYFAYGQNLTAWFPEYRNLGQARGFLEKMEDGSWQRRFAKAKVIVWPYEKKGQIIYQ